jgi:hypothetical protein
LVLGSGRNVKKSIFVTENPNFEQASHFLAALDGRRKTGININHGGMIL